MSKLAIDLQNIAAIIDADVNNVQRVLNGTIESLLKQIEPDDTSTLGSTLYFDSQTEQVYWDPSNESTDNSELRNISIRFETMDKDKGPVMELEFGFVGNDDFEVGMDSLRIETKRDLIEVLLWRLNDQRNAKPKKGKKKK